MHSRLRLKKTRALAMKNLIELLCAQVLTNFYPFPAAVNLYQQRPLFVLMTVQFLCPGNHRNVRLSACGLDTIK
jgi:hypothetical protein